VGAEEGILFGSRARGDHPEGSDADLVVVSERFAGMPFPERLLAIRRAWRLPLFPEAVPLTRAEWDRLRITGGVVQAAAAEGIRVRPVPPARCGGGTGARPSPCLGS
jgi:hypothetical protein